MSAIWDSPAPDVSRWPPRACEGRDTDLFFAEGPGHSRRQDRAKRICGRCAALGPCAEYSIPIAALQGVWAGMSPAERADVRNKRQKEA